MEIEVTRHVLGTVDDADHGGEIEKINAFENGDYAAGSDLPLWWGWYNWPGGWSSFNGLGQVSWKLKLDPGQTLDFGYHWHYFWR